MLIKSTILLSCLLGILLFALQALNPQVNAEQLNTVTEHKPAAVTTAKVKSPPFSTARQLSEPAGRVILTIKGNIKLSNSNDHKARFDREMLSQLPQHVIHTSTPWTEGVQTFEGVAFSDLLSYVQAHGKLLKTIALDNYSLEIPIEELVKYSAILAIKKNGEYLRIRDKGPIWVVYPVDDHPELKQAVLTQYRQIWHLRTLIVE